MAGRRFTREEEEKLWNLHKEGKILKEISQELGRPTGSLSRVLARIEKRMNRSMAAKARAEKSEPYISKLQRENNVLKSILWQQVASGAYKIVDAKTGQDVL